MLAFIILGMSLALNIGLTWYVVRILRKFIFISENLSDLFLTTKAFEVFSKSLYSMHSYNGEPMIEELIYKIKDVNSEVEGFRDIFQYTIDEELEQELEEALNAEEEEQEKSLLYAGTRGRNS